MEDNIEVIEIKKRWDNIYSNVNDLALKCGRNPEDINIIAVSKTHPIELIVAAMKSGINTFGENYVQELKEKHSYLEELDLVQPQWHFIGHLQTNKVKYICPFVTMIHSVDSFKLAQEIDNQAEKNERIIDILLQVNTSGELSKSGCEPKEVFKLTEHVSKLNHIRINGLMTIGSFSDDMDLVRSEFKLLSDTRDKLVDMFPEINFKHLSMGMTGDYDIAIEEGATFIRIGTAIFGNRYYNR